MDNPFRKTSFTDPYDSPENYYGPLTNPAFVNKDSQLGKVRTFSMFEARSASSLMDDTGHQSDLSDKSPDEDHDEGGEGRDDFQKELTSPTSQANKRIDQVPSTHNPMPSDRRRSIVPIFEDINLDNIEDFDQRVNFEMASFPARSKFHMRRASIDDTYVRPKRFFINDIDLTIKELLKNEDTDHNYQITIDDNGPKVLHLGTANSNGYRRETVRGTYMLSNLLQELTIAKRFGRNQMILHESRLNENPVSRLKRLITTQFWKSLTRELTSDNIVEMSKDTKIKEEIVDDNGHVHLKDQSNRIYVPYNRHDQFEYFLSIKRKQPEIPLEIQYLPKNIDAKFVRSINKKPGLLALSSRVDPDDPTNMITQPYVVPGGRFNELYGWDSYMETVGLLVDVTMENQEHLRLARGMTENFLYEIDHYGKILNANRSYYLTRSQPPFLTDMALRVFNKTMEVAPEKFEDTMDFLKRATQAAIKEYKTVWCASPRYDEESGLSCYHSEGLGVPPETESNHFKAVLKPYVEKYGTTHDEFVKLYNEEKIDEPDLDEFFMHDRAVRESGHDTSYRLEGKCAYLATVDLNSLLYKYETDIGFILKEFFNDSFDSAMTDTTETSDTWFEKARLRKELMDTYLWNEEDSIYYDYNIKTKEQNKYESATTFWPLWAKVASPDQAEKLVRNSMPKFEEHGGLVAGTLKSRGSISMHRPSRQWDYPYGWAPQQILTWIGLTNYEHDGVARRLIYRWLYLITQAFVDYNGVIVEKYSVIKGHAPHKVDAEYGNQGLDFKGVATEGFGWVNASYVFGLTFLDLHAERCLGTLTPPDVFFRFLHPSEKPTFEI